MLAIAGVDVVGSGGQPLDKAPPTAAFPKTPKAETRVRAARFEFAANEPASFQCALDAEALASCTSPVKRRVKHRKHTFTVIATDAAGNAARCSPTPGR